MIELPWTYKPPYGVKLNRSHPLAQGLVSCYLLNEGGGNTIFDLVQGDRGLLQSGAPLSQCTWSAGGVHFLGANQAGINIPLSGLNIGSFSIMYFCPTTETGSFFDDYLNIVLSGDDRISVTCADGFIPNSYNLDDHPNIEELSATTSVELSPSSTCLTFDGSNNKLALNGKIEDTGAATSTTAIDFVLLGTRDSSPNRTITAIFSLVFIYNRDLSANEIFALNTNPYQIFEPLFIPSSLIEVGGVTIPADSGTFTQTGTAADLLKGSLVGADSGTYSQTGTDASLLFNRKITADGGTYTQTGSDISFLYDRVIDIETGEYLLTGSDVNFGGARTISADSGTYTQTGFDATLRENSLIDIENGTFSLTGTDNDLSTNRILRSDSGSFIHTGSNATLIYAGDIVIICDAGEYLCVDGSADLSYSGESTGLSMVRDVVQPVVRDVVEDVVR